MERERETVLGCFKESGTCLFRAGSKNVIKGECAVSTNCDPAASFLCNKGKLLTFRAAVVQTVWLRQVLAAVAIVSRAEQVTCQEACLCAHSTLLCHQRPSPEQQHCASWPADRGDEHDVKATTIAYLTATFTEVSGSGLAVPSAASATRRSRSGAATCRGKVPRIRSGWKPCLTKQFAFAQGAFEALPHAV